MVHSFAAVAHVGSEQDHRHFWIELLRKQCQRLAGYIINTGVDNEGGNIGKLVQQLVRLAAGVGGYNVEFSRFEYELARRNRFRRFRFRNEEVRSGHRLTSAR